MSVRVTAVKPEVLRWARMEIGLSTQQVATRMGRPVEQIEAWEDGTAWPTYAQLKKLASTVYKRPVAVFFFPAPPKEPELRGKFRSLPAAAFDELEPDTRYALRVFTARQSSLYELLGDTNPRPLITKELASHPRVDYRQLSGRIRSVLGVTLDQQVAWKSDEKAFKAWRAAIEASGVFVFKRAFRQKAVSGFCLHDTEFPIIVINNGTTFSRQIFTLLHELAHLIFGVNSLILGDSHFVDPLSVEGQTLEVACNRVAAAVLVPELAVASQHLPPERLIEDVQALATRYRVSREVILRRFLDLELVDKATYHAWSSTWTGDYLRARPQRRGGDHYANVVTYLGDAYLGIAFDQYYSGRIDLSQLSEHLGVRASQIGTLEDYVGQRG